MYNKKKRRSYAAVQKSAQGVRKNSGLKSDGDAASNASKDSSSKSVRLKGSRKLNPLYVVIRKFKTIWPSFDENMQNTSTKRATLNLAVRLSSKYYGDSFRFWQDLLDEANLLLDSKRFENACAAWGLDPRAVAEHLVCEGKATVNKVLKEGLENYGEKARMFSERLYVDARNLYSTSGNEKKTSENESSSEVEKSA